VPVLPVCLLEPIWAQFVVLLPDHPVGDAFPVTHERVGRRHGRVVFDHVVAALVHGSGHERIATPGCSDRTIRRRVRAWAEAGAAEQLHAKVLAQSDRLIGLDLDELAVDGCITTTLCGGERAGRSPVDRGKQGLKRSTLTDAHDAPSSRPRSPDSTRWDRCRTTQPSTSTAATTGRPPAACSTAAGSPPSSPGGAFPRRSRSAAGG
jgi:hypothetical protein